MNRFSVAWRKARLVAHVLHGAWTAATRFSRTDDDGRRALTRQWSLRFLALAGVQLVVHHDERRVDAGAMVVGNHVSWIDIYVINAWRPTPFVSKAEVRDWPVIGWLAAKLDTAFVQRDKRSDAKRIMHELVQRLQGGRSICVFPEGTTSDGVEVLPFHANLFQAAVSAGAPVQPICLMYEDAHGCQSTAPAYVGDITLGQSLDALLRHGPLTVHLYVGAALEAASQRRVVAHDAQRVVSDALSELQQRVKPPLTRPVLAQAPTYAKRQGDARSCDPALPTAPTLDEELDRASP
ncbi:1-acyl-sn-glycerol-3-phosphate acyltransferase [Mycetohabitans sp. B5]|uniref:Lyso-ornithine lipid acyltransferase n=1 Tax=Mycetohabitans endofungorum TaxID=417203 RepID=A0A2P5KCJ7_9BURK|nr:lysophospholipid acyltransferase family protein [Mycetohabitans endofungorum]MCG1055577.1 1-acyl-sn-glycerol-3-phosphate acyltransferase [Mycetohabitans sp. B5]PPB84428.1 lyso-ornithine lipid acyltransferase [Mycetohabitans endofungorum]